jgi:hypothetical protein
MPTISFDCPKVPKVKQSETTILEFHLNSNGPYRYQDINKTYSICRSLLL